MTNVLGSIASLEDSGLCQIWQHYWNTPACSVCKNVDSQKLDQCLTFSCVSLCLAAQKAIKTKIIRSKLQMGIWTLTIPVKPLKSSVPTIVIICLFVRGQPWKLEWQGESRHQSELTSVLAHVEPTKGSIAKSREDNSRVNKMTMLSCSVCQEEGASHSPYQEFWQKLHLLAAVYCSSQAPVKFELSLFASRAQSLCHTPKRNQAPESAHEHLWPAHNQLFWPDNQVDELQLQPAGGIGHIYVFSIIDTRCFSTHHNAQWKATSQDLQSCADRPCWQRESRY